MESINSVKGTAEEQISQIVKRLVDTYNRFWNIIAERYKKEQIVRAAQKFAMQISMGSGP